MEGKLRYKIGETEREFDFGNYALEMALEDLDASISDLAELLNRKMMKFLRVFIFHAAAYPVIKKGETLDFTPFDVHGWIDETGGVNGKFIVEVNRVVLKSLGLVQADETEKKRKPPKN